MFKRKWAIALFYLMFVFLVGAYCFFWPPTYEAAVRILVKNDRQEPVISAEQEGVRMISRPSVTEEDLNSEMAIATSSAVIEETAREAKLDTLPEHWLVRLLNAPVESMSEFYNSYHNKPNADKFAKAVARLARKVTVQPEKKSAIIDLKVRWGDPRFAEFLLRTLTANYVARHLAAHSAPDAQRFFEQEVQAKKEQLGKIESQIEAVWPGATTGSVDLERELYLKQASEFESEAKRAQAMLAEAQAQMQAGAEELKSLPSRITTEEKTGTNPLALGNLKTRFLDLELKRSDLLQKYKPTQPLVLAAEEQVAQAQRMLDKELAGSAIEKSTNVNPLGQTLQQDVALNLTKLKGFEALGASMSRLYGDYRTRLDDVARRGATLQRLQREHRIAEQNLAAYEKQYEDARVNDQLDRLRFVNVTPIEEPRADADPVKPSRWLLMKLALSLGLLLGIGFGFLLELLDQRVRNERDLELGLDVPVLATLDFHPRHVRI